MARQDERGDLGIAEPLEQAPDVAIDRLLPYAPTPIEIAAHERAVDAGIDGRGIKGYQAALGVADDADLRRRAAARPKAVDRREHFLHLVPDHVAAHVERLPVQPLAPGLLALGELRVARLDGFSPDQYWDEQFAAAIGKDAAELMFRRQPGREAEDLLGRLTGIGDDNDVRCRRALGRLHVQPFGPDAVEHGPANLEDTVAVRLGHKRRMFVVSEAFQAGRQARVDRPYDLAQPIAIFLDRRIPGGSRRAIVLPESRRSRLDVADLTLDKPMRPVHHPGRKILLGPVDGCGLRQRFGRCRDLHGRRVPCCAPSDGNRRSKRQTAKSRTNPTGHLQKSLESENIPRLTEGAMSGRSQHPTPSQASAAFSGFAGIRVSTGRAASCFLTPSGDTVPALYSCVAVALMRSRAQAADQYR